MEKKVYNFRGEDDIFKIEVPAVNGGVCTSMFCPEELLTGVKGQSSTLNGESEEEFIADCQNQIIGMGAADKNDSKLDKHIAGLMAVVMDHLSRFERLIFGDLLIYMDCFSLLLKADGFMDSEIKYMYPRVTRTIVDLYPDRIKNTADLSPFKGSCFDMLLLRACHTAC